MSLMAVPTSRHGDSLPAELRVGAAFRNSPYFSRARFAAGQKGLTQAPALTLSGLRGLWGLGQDDGGDEGSGDGGDGSGSGSGGSGTSSCAGTLCADGSVMNADCVCGVPAPPPLTLPPVDTTPPCMPTGGVGPLQPNQVWCATGTGAPPVMSGSCAGTCTNGTFMDQSSCTCVGAPSLQSLGVTASQIPGYGQAPNYNGPYSAPPNSNPPPAPSGYQWASLINASGQTLAKVLAVSQGGSAITLPNGEQLLFGSATSAAAGSLLSTSSLGSLLPLLLIGGGLWLILSMRK
jgi:hypothetical protein